MRTAFEASLSIGDVTFHLVSEDRRLAPAADGLLRPFFVDPRRADVEIRARWTDTPAELGGDVLFDSGPPWQLFQSGNEFLFTFRSANGGPVPYKTARFNQTFTIGDVQLYRPHFDHQSSDFRGVRLEPNRVNPLDFPLNELLMIHVLSQGKGVEVHGCALVDAAGRAYVFPGQSGAGKSTLARLWSEHPGVRLLSDERVVVRTDRQPIVVYGTPWHGDARVVSPQSGQLAGVFFLHHAATHAVVPTSRSLAAAQLLACSFLPFHSAKAVERTMAAVEQATRAAPCYDLWFAPDASVIDVLAKYMPAAPFDARLRRARSSGGGPA